MLINIYCNLVITSLSTSDAGIRCIYLVIKFTFCFVCYSEFWKTANSSIKFFWILKQILIAKLILTQSEIIYNSKYFSCLFSKILMYMLIRYNNNFKNVMYTYVHCFYYFKHVKFLSIFIDQVI